MFGFAATTLMLGLYQIQTRHITIPNMIVGMAFAFGGLAQLLAGMWEFGIGNTFGATVFSSYGGFWISYAIVIFPPAGIAAAFKDNMDDFNDAIGIFLMVWFVVSVIFFFGTFKASVMLSALLLFVCMGYLLLMIGYFRDQESVLKAGGVFCCLAAFTAFYIGAAELHASAGALCLLPVGNLKETSVHGLCTKKKSQ
ncbi:glyoxylate pathway regulator [Ceratobasidium sp. AG-Ba]|nr:glyoxylate pathway regulator [Ceratobasidium sp. AG-Ba]